MNPAAVRFLSALLVVVSCCLGSASAQPTYDQFVRQLNLALDTDRESAIDKVIRVQPEDAILHFSYLTGIWAVKQEDDHNREAMDKMKASFRRVFEVDTLDKVERYYSLLSGERLNDQRKLETLRLQLDSAWRERLKEKDRKGIRALIEPGIDIGRRFDEIGNRFLAAQVYSLLGTMLNQMPSGTDEEIVEDKRLLIDVLHRYTRARQAWDWTKDTTYYQWTKWLENLESQFAAEEKAAKERADAGLKKGAVGLARFIDPAISPLVGKLRFQPLKELPEDSLLIGGPVPVNWLSASIQEGPGKLYFFKKGELLLVREGAAKVALKFGASGEEQEVDVGARVKPSIFHLSTSGDDGAPYSMVFYLGSEAEPFAGTTTNLSPTPTLMTIYYRSSSSWVTEIDGVDVTFYDDNSDGLLFTEDPMAFGLTTRMLGEGLEKETPVPAYDSMQIGRGPVIPYSACAQIGDKWYFLDGSPDGTSVVAKALHPEFFETGTIKFDWSGSREVKPQLLVLRGKDELQSAAFNVAGGKPVEVPVGKYEIAYGRSTKGKGGQTQMVHVFKGESSEIVVEAGKETKLELGAPFRFDFVLGGTGDAVAIDSLFFRIKGAAGEVYAKVQGPPAAPEVVVAKNENGRGAKVMGEYVPIQSPQIITDASRSLDKRLAAAGKQDVRSLGSEVAYFPVVKGDREASTVLEFTLPYTGGLVGLRVKKHKLFGKIDPIFKGR